MSDNNTYRRHPAVSCWIKHLLKGIYNEGDRTLYTVFGKIKRVRMTSTIIEKKITKNNKNSDIEPSDRVEFELIDGTGKIRAIVWRGDHAKYRKFSEGDIIDMVGLIKKYNDTVMISPEIIRIVDNPNFVLLKNAEIMLRIKKGDVIEMPKYIKEYQENNFEDINIESLFEEDHKQLTDVVLGYVEKYTFNQNGISRKLLSKNLNKEHDISSIELDSILKNLELQSKIYQSEQGVFQAY